MDQSCPKCDGQQPDATAWNYGISLQEASSLDIYSSMVLNRFANLFFVYFYTVLHEPGDSNAWDGFLRQRDIFLCAIWVLFINLIGFNMTFRYIHYHYLMSKYSTSTWAFL